MQTIAAGLRTKKGAHTPFLGAFDKDFDKNVCIFMDCNILLQR